ncbi:unnamed protein product, partial [marine sediment metagenome]
YKKFGEEFFLPRPPITNPRWWPSHTLGGIGGMAVAECERQRL